MNKTRAALFAASCMWFSGGILIAADTKAPVAATAVKPAEPAVVAAKPAEAAAVAAKPAETAVVTPKPAGTFDVVAVPKIDPEKPPVMEVKVSPWQPVEPAKDAKPVGMLLLSKGDGHDDWVIKMVSVCDQNNIWCVANDGTKDAVYQLTSKGLEHRFDGVYVAAGKGIVTAINAQREVFELDGGTGTAWKKIDGLKLTKISRPNHDVGWGLLEEGKGVASFFSYDHDAQKWHIVKNSSGQPAKGIVDCSANAEDVTLALNDKGELLKSDLQRMQLYEKAKKVMDAPPKKGHQKGGKEAAKKGAGKQHGNHETQKKHATAGKKGGGKKVPPKKHVE